MKLPWSLQKACEWILQIQPAGRWSEPSLKSTTSAHLFLSNALGLRDKEPRGTRAEKKLSLDDARLNTWSPQYPGSRDPTESKTPDSASELSCRRDNDGKQARYFAHDLPYCFGLAGEPGTQPMRSMRWVVRALS